jgi:hypothetical protein
MSSHFGDVPMLLIKIHAFEHHRSIAADRYIVNGAIAIVLEPR